MANKGLSMRKVREVLRLHHVAGLSARAIARSLKVSPVTVRRYVRRSTGSNHSLLGIERNPATPRRDHPPRSAAENPLAGDVDRVSNRQHFVIAVRSADRSARWPKERSPRSSLAASAPNWIGRPGANSLWKPGYPEGLERLAAAGRVHVAANSIRYRRFASDFPCKERGNLWTDTLTGSFTGEKMYVVQTNPEVVERCLLMTSDPGDLVLDPTCGSGTTAWCAEKWGRRRTRDRRQGKPPRHERRGASRLSHPAKRPGSGRPAHPAGACNG